jgi:hypothetical protein
MNEDSLESVVEAYRYSLTHNHEVNKISVYGEYYDVVVAGQQVENQKVKRDEDQREGESRVDGFNEIAEIVIDFNDEFRIEVQRFSLS